jgi:hypothetical protein
MTFHLIRFIPPFAGRGRPTSAGFAARMAGKPLPEMLTLLSSQGIPLTGNAKPLQVRP